MEEVFGMKHSIFILVCSVLLGCAREVGDACSTSLDCDTSQVCDTLSAGGYCTIKDCDDDCPYGSTCVTFENNESFCMDRCLTQLDCRDGYECFESSDGKDYCRVQND